jgi:hypothetical protein
MTCMCLDPLGWPDSETDTFSTAFMTVGTGNSRRGCGERQKGYGMVFPSWKRDGMKIFRLRCSPILHDGTDFGLCLHVSRGSRNRIGNLVMGDRTASVKIVEVEVRRSPVLHMQILRRI